MIHILAATPTEREVLAYALAGMSKEDICAELGISRKTVNHYFLQLRRRNQAKDNMQLLVKAKQPTQERL